MSYAVAKWRDKGINLRVAVNISARQLADQTIFTALKQVLRELNFEYCPIDVELTESCLIENDELALSVIQQFSQLGAQVHLDDFGTGYSSLSQLARFPIDAIKLDPGFCSRYSQTTCLAVVGPGDRRCGPCIESSGDR